MQRTAHVLTGLPEKKHIFYLRKFHQQARDWGLLYEGKKKKKNQLDTMSISKGPRKLSTLQHKVAEKEG